MHTFAQKQNSTQRTKSAGSTTHGKTSFVQNHEAHSILHLQRTVGNQAVRRLLRANAEKLEVGSATTVTTRFAHDFSQIPVYTNAPVRVQAKLTISTPCDIYDPEADRIADQLLHSTGQRPAVHVLGEITDGGADSRRGTSLASEAA